MIYHIFNADVYFHVKRMLDKFLTYSSQRNFYILHLTKEQYRSEYEAIFRSHNCNDYYITKPYSEKLPRFFSVLCRLKKEQLNPVTRDLLRILATVRTEKLLFHGYFFTVLVHWGIALGYFRCASWVFWGANGFFYGGGGIKNKILNAVVKLSLRKMDKILFLLQGDLDAVRVYHKKNNFLCPYARGEEEDIARANIVISKKTTKVDHPKILVGNNGYVRGGYLEFSQKLIPYKDAVMLSFMCNYPADDAKYDELRTFLNTNHFNYSLWREIVPIENYLQTFAENDVYACHFETQSGLGAIHYAICLGKTVYLRGYNYEWLKQLGFYVETTEQLLEHLKNREPIVFEQRILDENRRRYHEISSPRDCIMKWDAILSA